MPVEITCQECGKKFKVKPHRVKTAKYCSNECKYKIRSLIELTCQYCGKPFKIPRYQLNHRSGNYCSHSCRDNGRKRTIIRKCAQCGKEFKTTPGRIKDNRGIHCSKQCFYNSKKKSIERQCPVCNKIFHVNPSGIKRGQGKYCSNKCYHSVAKLENHPSWKGGISFEPYCSKFNFEFKERVREFWGRTCGLCRKSEKTNGKLLSVHHVNYEKMVCCNDTPPIFIPLCVNCHTKTNWNREHWERVLTEFVMIWFDGESYLPK